jgi:WD40 repeat protein
VNEHDVHALAFDTRTAALWIGSETGSVRLLDLTTGASALRIGDRVEPPGYAFPIPAPKWKFASWQGRFSERRDLYARQTRTLLEVLSLADGKPLFEHAVPSNRAGAILEEPGADAFFSARAQISSGSELVAIARADGVIEVWSVPERRVVRELWERKGGQTWALAFSPDGKTLASAHWDGRIRLWSLAGVR